MALLIAVALFLAAHLAAGLTRQGAPWAFDSLRYLPSAATWAFAAASVLLIAAGAIALRRPPLGAPSVGTGAPPARVRLATGAVVVTAFVAATIVLQSAVHLLGDGRMYLTALPAGTAAGKQLVAREPLGFAIVRAVYLALGRGPDAAVTAFRLCSHASGLLYAALALIAADRLVEGRRERALVVGTLLGAGFVQLFCGYVETYALVYPPLLAFLLTVLLAAEGRGPLWLPAAVLGVALPLHFSLAVFAPLLPAAVLVRGRPTRALVRQGAFALALAVALAAVVFVALGIPWSRYQEGVRGDNLLAVSGPLSLHQAYHLFSLAHWADVLQACALAAPAALLALPLARPGRRPVAARARLLALACLLPLLAIFGLNAEVGAFRDWDLLSLPALPLSLWAGLRLARADAVRRRPVLGWVVVGAAGLHTLAWLAVNALPAAAEARFADNLERGALSVHARGYGWETLGEHYRVTRPAGREALQAFDRARQADPWNTRYWNLAAERYAEAGDTETAARYLRRAIELKPDSNPENYQNLGRLLLARGECDEAAARFRRAVELEPRYLGARLGLADALNCLGRPGEAAAELEAALRQRPGAPELLAGLGVARLRAGQAAAAREALAQAVAAAPGDLAAWTALAAACEALGDGAGLDRCRREIGRLQAAGAGGRR